MRSSSVGFRDFTENEWDLFWDMITAFVADIPEIKVYFEDLGSKTSAFLGTVNAGLKLRSIIKQHQRFHDEVKKKIYQHVPEEFDESIITNLTRELFKCLKETKGEYNKSVAWFYVKKEDEKFADMLYSFCFKATSINISDIYLQKKLRFFLGEIAKVILDPENVTLLTDDKAILKDLMKSTRDLNGNYRLLQCDYVELKGEHKRLQDAHNALADEVDIRIDDVNENISGIKKVIADQNEETIKRIDTLAGNVEQLRNVQSSEFEESTADNEEFENHFYDPLFLEDENSQVTLSSMYVSPHIRIEEEDVSASEYIMTWYQNVRTKNTCMLLYGRAGVGKSTLVSKIIVDANDDSSQSNNKEFNLAKEQVLAVALRDHYEEIDINDRAEKMILDLFQKVTLKDLRNKLLILDGLDEICVLRHDFNGFEFLKQLSKLSRGFHVLVTSRESDSYFENPSRIDNLIIERLQWTKDEVSKWCEKYCDVKKDKGSWCETFISDYRTILDEPDERKNVFCVPIILYICGERNITITDHSSVGSIYNDVFRSILVRDHIDGQGYCADLTDADKNSIRIAWQYTKELAYQMFLLDTLDLADSDGQDDRYRKGLENAKSRTKSLLKDKYELDVQDDALEIKKELALCPFTKANGEKGITFAHKTVYEYFTAVKLYEDYFAQFNTEYFNKTIIEELDDEKIDEFNDEKCDTIAMEVIKNIIQAFRYKTIPKEIMAHLIEMKQAPFYGEADAQSFEFSISGFAKSYAYGMKKHLLSKVGIPEAIGEYQYDELQENPILAHEPWMKNSLRAQICRVIGNVTCFLKYVSPHALVGIGQNISDSFHNLFGVHSAQNEMINVDISGMDLSGAVFNGEIISCSNLDGANLSGASLNATCFMQTSLKGTILSGALMKGALLNNAVLSNAVLIGTNLSGADLKGAILTNTDLRGADLRGADLRGVDLSSADLRGAKYCKNPDFLTQFPDDKYDPDTHGMIEVDKSRNIVKK